MNRFVPADAFPGVSNEAKKSFHCCMLHIDILAAVVPLPLATAANSNWLSLQFASTSPILPTLCSHPSSKSFAYLMVEDDEDFDTEKAAVQRSGSMAGEKRHIHRGHIYQQKY